MDKETKILLIFFILLFVIVLGIISFNVVPNGNQKVVVENSLCGDYSQMKEWCSDSCVINNQTDNPYIYSNEPHIFICSCINSIEENTQNYVPVSHLNCEPVEVQNR